MSERRFETIKVEVHPEYFHLTLLETNPSEILEVANGVLERFEGLARTRRQDREIRWLKGKSGSRAETADRVGTEAATAGHYRPRVYFTTGTFDLGVLFLTPALEMASWLQDHRTLVAGHDSNICLLPTAKSLFEPEERESLGFDPADRDFNRSFIEEFHSATAAGGAVATGKGEIKAQPDHLRFVSITKLKFNPLVTWAEPTDPVEKETGRIRDAFQRLWMAVDTWQRESEKQGPAPQVALGLSFGWNEALIVAHAASPDQLLRLVIGVRQISTWTEVKDEERDQGHLALTTLTTVGYDIELRQAALKALKRQRTAKISAARLLDLAAVIEKERVTIELEGRPDLEVADIFMQVGCHAYPGHELDLLEMLFDLEEALIDKGILDESHRGQACIDVGKRDVWTPYLPMSSTYLGPVGMAALVSLIQQWLRNSGSKPKPSKSKALVPAAFDFYTRLGWIPRLRQVGKRSKKAERKAAYRKLLARCGFEPLPGRHVRGLPRTLLTPPKVARYLQRLPEGSEGDDPSFLDSLRRSMRILQLPYPLSEQILNVINIFCWAQNREVIWDESIELISPILAFASFVERREGNWTEDIENYRQLKIKLNSELYGHLLDKERLEIQESLRSLPQKEVFEFLQAMRAYFYTTQFSNYLMGEMPDLNLRFKGSLHQLLRMSNMIFDALVDVVMGPRACLAIITDTVAPKVKMSCDVPVVELNSSSFTAPVVLESLAHEVSHLFLQDLAVWYQTPEEREQSQDAVESVRDSRSGAPRREHMWASDSLLPGEGSRKKETMEEVRWTFSLLEENIFFGQTAHLMPHPEIDRFMEATSDFMEAELLGYGVPFDAGGKPRIDEERVRFDRWLQSFMLRILLSTRNLASENRTQSVDGKTVNGDSGTARGPREVPQPDEKMIESAIIRAALVKIFRVLVLRNAEWYEEEFELNQFKKDYFEQPLWELRQSLRDKCLLGMSTEHLEDLLERDNEGSLEFWNKFCSREATDLRFFADRYAIETVANFHEALKTHLEEDLGRSYQGAGRFWPTIRDCFSEQWQGREGREGIGSVLSSGIFVQHWLERDQLADLRQGKDLPQPRPWKAHLQPLARHWGALEGEPGTEARLHFYQRGRLQPVSDEDQQVWNGAIQRFLVRLLSMVPAWHRSVLDEIDRVLKMADEADSDEGSAEAPP